VVVAAPPAAKEPAKQQYEDDLDVPAFLRKRGDSM
jgi:hypothetical protein